MTKKQRDLLERILKGESLMFVLNELSVTRPTWNRWMEDREFRSAVAGVVEQKELVEVIDALTLNRRAYNKLLKACRGDEEGKAIEGDAEESEKGEREIDEKHARIYLSIIEAMAKRLAELAPRLMKPGTNQESGEGTPPEPTEEEYDALARYFAQLRGKTKGRD